MVTFTGDSADNIFTGSSGNDDIAGGPGADTINGSDGNDVLYSDVRSPAYNLPYYGNPYTPPVLDTGTEVDTLIGGNGSDTIFAGYGDNVDGGSDGSYGDYLFISFLGAPTGVVADFRQQTQVIGGGTITGMENISWVQGSNFDDDINVGSYSNSGYSNFTVVMGMGGNDHLVAGYYTGVMDGGDGNDVVDGRPSQYLQLVSGGNGNDTLYTNSNTFAQADGGPGDDTIYSHGTTHGGPGNDLIIMQQTYYPGTVFGDDGDDVIWAAPQGNTIYGGDGADVIHGGTGADLLFSSNQTTTSEDMGSEHDSIDGGGGDDTISVGYGDDADGGAGNDTLQLSLAGAGVGLTFSTAGIVGGTVTVGGGTLQNFEVLGLLRGTDFDDVLTLATQSSLLTVDAGDGNDVIIAGSSSVSVQGGNGNDRFVSGPAADIFDGGPGFDTVDYSTATAGVTVLLAVRFAGHRLGPRRRSAHQRRERPRVELQRHHRGQRRRRLAERQRRQRPAPGRPRQ